MSTETANWVEQKLDINSSNIDKVVSDWISQVEAKAILDKLQYITEPLPENLSKVRADLQEINWEKKELTEQTKSDLKNLLMLVENNKNTNESPVNKESFSWLKEDLSKNSEVMNKVFSISDIYFEERLKWYNLLWIEKENIKLILWDNLINNLDFKWWMWLVVKAVNWKVKELFNWVENKEGQDLKNVTSVLDNLSKIYTDLSQNKSTDESNLLYTTFDWILWNNFKNIEKTKEQGVVFDSLEKTSMNVNWDSVWNKTFEQIKQETLDKAKTLDWLKSSWDAIKWLFEQLPEGWWEQIKDFLKNISEKYPILWFFISLFLGDEFLEANWWEWKSKQSLLNLSNLVEKVDSNSPLKKLKIDELKSVDPKSLEKFFKYLDGKDIDYSSDDFWKWLLTWESGNEKANEVNKYLKNAEWNVIEWNEKYVENLIKKLNNVADLENDYKIKENKAKMSSWTEQKNKPEQNTWVNEDSGNKTEQVVTDSKTEQQVQEVWKVDETPKQKSSEDLALEFDTSVRELKSLPWEIVYNWEKVKVDIANGKELILGENRYNISILALWMERFDNVIFKEWNLYINDQIIEKEKLILALGDLLKTWIYTFDWRKNFVSYEWKITKVV